MEWLISHWWAPFAAFWILSWTLTTLQVRSYRSFVQSVRSTSHPHQFLSTGIGKGWLRPGCVAALVTDQTGMVVEAYSMRGWSVFARFRPWPAVVGHHVTDWASLPAKKVTPSQKALLQAAVLALRQHQEQNAVKCDFAEMSR